MDDKDSWTSVPADEKHAGPFAKYSKSLDTDPYDHREYKVIKLPNGILAIVVQDATTAKMAAVVSVGAGSIHEPVCRPRPVFSPTPTFGRPAG